MQKRTATVVKFSIFLLAIHTATANYDECPEIISKSTWSNKAAKTVNYLIIPLPYVIIHHTVSRECTTLASCGNEVQNIQSYHMDTLGWNDIGYSFLVGGDGNIYEGTGWTAEGAHTYGYNKKSLGIAFIGNFDEKNASQKMVDAVHKLILCGKAQGTLRDNVRVIAARQVQQTISPGFNLFRQIQNWPEWSSTL